MEKVKLNITNISNLYCNEGSFSVDGSEFATNHNTDLLYGEIEITKDCDKVYIIWQQDYANVYKKCDNLILETLSLEYKLLTGEEIEI